MAEPTDLVSGEGGLPKVILTALDGARAEVYLHGAHVTSWIPADGGERLFLSSRSEFRPGAAIRGGVPVVFPQFSDRGPLPKHGFARTTEWDAIDDGAQDGTATFRLTDSTATRALWPYGFELLYTVSIAGPTLSMRLNVRNTGDDPFTFMAALHTYVRVEDIRDVVVRGLEGLRYLDSVTGGGERRQREAEQRIEGEVDRVYLDTRDQVEVRQPGRTTIVRMDAFRDVVLWNPGPEKAATLQDLEPGGYVRMLCVEAGVIGTPVELAPGARWTGEQIMTAQ